MAQKVNLITLEEKSGCMMNSSDRARSEKRSKKNARKEFGGTGSVRNKAPISWLGCRYLLHLHLHAQNIQAWLQYKLFASSIGINLHIYIYPCNL